MLVLTRKKGERIMIGNDIIITVVELQPGKVRLGIEAPRSMAVYREELLPVKTPEQSPADPETSH